MTFVNAQLKVAQNNTFILNTDFTLPPYGITALFGPSGAGKSTLLKCLAGLIPRGICADSHLTVGGETWMSASAFVQASDRSVGLVFQQPQLFPHLSVLENLQYADQRRRQAPLTTLTEAVDRFELSTLLKRYPNTLSGGEAQRVALARAVVNAPRLLLLDEPLTALDHRSRAQLLTAIHQLSLEKNVPIVYVSHQWDEIIQIADRVQMIAKGHISRSETLQALTTDIEFLTKQQHLASAILMTQVKRQVQEEHLTELTLGDQSLLIPKIGLTPGSALRVLVKMSDVSLIASPSTQSSILNTLACRIVHIEEQAGHALIILNCEGQYLSANITARSRRLLDLTVGQVTYAQIKATTLGQ